MFSNQNNAKKRIVLLVTLVIVSVNFLMASGYTFRVQCAKTGQSDLNEILPKIPNKEVFFIQGANALYFSGWYTDDLFDAMALLDKCHGLGIPGAFIRVFQNGSYISDEASDNLLRLIMSGKLSPGVLLKYQKKKVEYEKMEQKRLTDKLAKEKETKRLASLSDQERLAEEKIKKAEEQKRIEEERLAAEVLAKKEAEEKLAKEKLELEQEQARLAEEARVIAEQKRIEEQRVEWVV